MSDNVSPDTASQEPAAETPKTESPLEKRLATILGVTKELQADRDRGREESREIRTVLTEISQRLDALASTRQPASSGNPPTNPFSGPKVDPATSNPSDLQDAVKRAVAEALTPVIQAQSAQQKKLEKHRESFSRVVERDPAFADPSAPEKQLFDRIYGTRQDLQALEDAPAVIAEVVRGLVADQRAEARALDVAKTRGNLPSTVGRGHVPSDSQKVGEMFAALQKKGETQGLSEREWGDYLHLATAVASLKGEAK